MIVRVWTTTFDPAGKDRLLAYASEVSLPLLSSRDGCQGALFFASGNTWITQTFWRDKAAIDALEDDPEYRCIVDGILALNVLGQEQQVALYAFEGGWARID
jgi:hypothetical protein